MRRSAIQALLAVTLGLPSAAHAVWTEARSAHFVVIGNGRAGEIEAMAAELEQFDSVIRRFHSVKDDSAARANPLTVYVVPDADDVRKYCRGCPAGVAGFYDGRASGSVAWTPRRNGDGGRLDLKPRQVLFHEYGHHFLLGNFGMAYPAWFSEGYAEFVATVTHNKDGFQVGAPPLYRAWGLVSGTPLKARDFFDPMRRRTLTDQQRDALYGRGWLLTHYLMMDSGRLQQLQQYLTALNGGTPSPEAATKAFGDADQLDLALNRYLNARTIKVVQIAPSVIDAPKIDSRALTPGQAALIAFRMESRAGVDDTTAKPLYARAAAAAAPFPDDAVVQGWLAEMALDAGDIAAAQAAAERALKADPDQPQALIYLARARMAALAKTPGDAAAWSKARSPIVRANRANPDAAEPLLLYYESFAREGRAPPPIAIQGLYRAVELVPQDAGLRFTAVRQAVMEKKLPLAIRMLRPLAYDPHLPPDNPAAQLLANLSSPDADKALAKFDAAVSATEKKPDPKK